MMGFLSKLFGTDTKAAGAEPTPYNKYNTKVISLFIVDDNEAFVRLIENHLINKEKEKILQVRFNITKFYSGEECLLNLHLKPDIILLDYYMSNNGDPKAMNGDEVFKKIIEIDPTQKVVMLSGLEESTIVFSLIKMGLRDYIMKDDEMFEQLHHVLVEVFQAK